MFGFGGRKERERPLVLVIEDDDGVRQMLLDLLTAMKLDALGAPNGHEGLSLTVDKLPNLVLLDIQLPDLDGLAVAKALSSEPEPPAVVLVSSRDAADYGPLLDGCGALGFIAKADLSAESLTALLGA